MLKSVRKEGQKSRVLAKEKNVYLDSVLPFYL